jgi:ribosomal protein RSM22 (predicted rRNA methylase)
MITRTPAQYAALCRVFNEMKLRDPSFKPKTLFDFGSGLGSVTW